MVPQKVLFQYKRRIYETFWFSSRSPLSFLNDTIVYWDITVLDWLHEKFRDLIFYYGVVVGILSKSITQNIKYLHRSVQHNKSNELSRIIGDEIKLWIFCGQFKCHQSSHFQNEISKRNILKFNYQFVIDRSKRGMKFNFRYFYRFSLETE